MRLKPSDIGSCWDHQRARMGALKWLGFEPKSILDIGAYHGSWSEVMWHTWPNAKYVLVEGNSDCEEKLRSTGFEYHIALLSDREKEVEYYKSGTGSGEGNSIYREKTNYPFSSTKVTTKTIGQVVGNQQFDLIKVDAQGSELDIIKGSPHIFASAKIVQLECQIQSYNDGAPKAQDVINLMDVLGFRLYDIVEFHYSNINMLIQADFLFARKDSGLFDIPKFA